MVVDDRQTPGTVRVLPRKATIAVPMTACVIVGTSLLATAEPATGITVVSASATNIQAASAAARGEQPSEALRKQQERNVELMLAARAATGGLHLPVAHPKIVVGYGQMGPYWKVAHSGLDFQAEIGTAALAVTDGTIRAIFTHPAYGLVVQLVRADGVEIWYCHLSQANVIVDQQVKAGDKIALTGASGNVSGPHLHLEVRVNHVPTDPWVFLEETPGTTAPAPEWASAYFEDPPAGISRL